MRARTRGSAGDADLVPGGASPARALRDDRLRAADADVITTLKPAAGASDQRSPRRLADDVRDRRPRCGAVDDLHVDRRALGAPSRRPPDRCRSTVPCGYACRLAGLTRDLEAGGLEHACAAVLRPARGRRARRPAARRATVTWIGVPRSAFVSAAGLVASTVLARLVGRHLVDALRDEPEARAAPRSPRRTACRRRSGP